MAMISCPECGQEISDKAKKCIHCGKVLIEEEIKTKKCSECETENSLEATECIHCGCPFEEVAIQEKETNNQPKKDIKKIIIPIVAVVIAAIIGVVIYNVKVVKPKNTYIEAVAMLEKGKYDEANKLFSTIEGYSDVETIQEQLKYELYVYECISDWKHWLENPNSFTLYEVAFFLDSESHGMYAQSSLFGEVDYSYPAIVVRSGAQNVFGGNTTGYELFYYIKDEGYTCMGSCDSLDEDDYYDSRGELKDEDDGAMEVLLCREINELRSEAQTVGDVDMDRLKAVIKNDNYSTIKIIE